MKNSSIVRRHSFLFAAFFLFGIGIAFGSSNEIQFSATCSGAANGAWNYVAKEHGTCTCPQSIPLPAFGPAYQINVCQDGSRLTGSAGTIHLTGTAVGQQMSFTTVNNFNFSAPGIKVQDVLKDTNRGTLSGNTISGNVTSDWRIKITGGGDNISCGCNLSGTFKVNLNGSTGDDDDDDDDDGPPPQVHDVSQTSGIANQNVETTGVQWVDFNKDGKQDLFLAGKNANALFKNVGGGHFAKVGDSGGLMHISEGILGLTSFGVAWADFDNDGDQDAVFFLTSGQVTFLRNTNGTFAPTSIVTYASPAGTSAGSTLAGIWTDYNNDGKVDAYIIKDGAPNQLFKNLGDGHFQDVAATAHVNVTGPGRSAVSADFNGDGLADLYVVNFHAPNKLFLNNGNGTFRATTAAPFAGASVQAVVGDYNNDKKFDILVVNNGGPSVLFKNTGNDASGNPKFAKVNAGISALTHGITAGFADFNNDGFLDLILIQSVGGNVLFQNNGAGVFSPVTTLNLNGPKNATSLTLGDFDNNGLIDIMIGDGGSTQTNGDSLYKNDSQKNHWLEVALQGTTSNRSGINAVAIIRNGTTFQAQVVSGGNGHNQDSLVMHFGLGTNAKVDEMDILWSSGVLQRCLNVNANKKVAVTEGNPSNLNCQ